MRETATPIYLLCRFLLRILFRVFNRWEVTGQEHIPPRGGVLLIANHTSYSDPPIVGAACARPVHFMAKAELFDYPLLGALIRRTHAFPVHRGRADRGALRRGVRVLREGKVLLVFPEGTRSHSGRLEEMERGAAFIALSARAQVVPCAIIGADRVLPPGKPILLPAKLRVRFGPPLDLSQPTGQGITGDALDRACEQMASSLRSLLPPDRR